MVRKGWPKWLAILALILLLIGVFAGVFWLVIHSFRQMFAGLGETEAQMGDRLQALGGSIGNLVLSTGVEDTGARLSLKLWFVFLTMFAFGWLMGPPASSWPVR